MPAKARLRRQRLNNCTMLEPKSYIRHAAFTMTTAMLEKHLIANCWQCLRRQFSIINPPNIVNVCLRRQFSIINCMPI